MGGIRRAIALVGMAVAACTPSHEYVPSAHHAHRPLGAIYNDEVGENVLSASRRRIIEVFGPPAALGQGGRCMLYRIVRQPPEQWRFCFRRDGTMAGAGVVYRR